MAWTTIKKVKVGNIITEDYMNEQIRDNLSYLKSANYDISGYSATNTAPNLSWGALDSTNIKVTLTTTGGDILFSVLAMAALGGGTAAGNYYLDINFDIYDVENTTRLSGTDNGFGVLGNNRPVGAGSLEEEDRSTYFSYILKDVDAGTHNYELWARRVERNNPDAYILAIESDTAGAFQFFALEI